MKLKLLFLFVFLVVFVVFFTHTHAVADSKSHAIFIGYFDTPVTEISELKGGGYETLRGYDYWVRFKSPKPVMLKSFNRVDAESPDLEVLSKQFLKLCPEDKKALLDIDNLKAGHGTEGVPLTHWVILLHKKLNLYWFRTWCDN
jgi:hypothetical protein